MLIVLRVVEGTPKWVFIVLAYLAWQAGRRLKPTSITLYRILITPSIFLVWGLLGLTLRPGDSAVVLGHWLAGALAGTALGVMAPQEMSVDRRRRLVLFPGSTLPLLRVILIFGAHYALNVAAALNPLQRVLLLNLDICVSGASAAYFLTWASIFLRRYRRVPPIVPSASGVTP